MSAALLPLLSGFLITGQLIAGLFFLRFWHSSRDRLFAMFAVAFWLLAIQRLLLSLTRSVFEDQALFCQRLQRLIDEVLTTLVTYGDVLLICYEVVNLSDWYEPQLLAESCADLFTPRIDACRFRNLGESRRRDASLRASRRSSPTGPSSAAPRHPRCPSAARGR